MDRYEIQQYEAKRTKRWKEIQMLWSTLKKPEFNKWSLEGPMCRQGNKSISIEHFLVTVIGEIGYDAAKKIERSLRKINEYMDINEFSDWRYVYACLQIIHLYKLVKVKPKELLIRLFDLLSEEDTTNTTSSNSTNMFMNKTVNTMKDTWYLYNISQAFYQLFMLPVLTLDEESMMIDHLLSMNTTLNSWNTSSNSLSYSIHTASSSSSSHSSSNNRNDNSYLPSIEPMNHRLSSDPSIHRNSDTALYTTTTTATTSGNSIGNRVASSSSNNNSIGSNNGNKYTSAKKLIKRPSFSSSTSMSALPIPLLLQSIQNPVNNNNPSSSSSLSSSILSLSLSSVSSNAWIQKALERNIPIQKIKITTSLFRKLLDTYPTLVTYWCELIWNNCIPSELKLDYYNEIEVEAIHQSDIILQHHSMYLAKCTYTKYQIQKAIKRWLDYTRDTMKLKLHLGRKFFKRSKRYFQFWHQYTKEKLSRSKRTMLARSIYRYTIKARCFARIKLYNYTNRKIQRAIGTMDENAKYISQGAYHLKRVMRQYSQRQGFLRWHGMIGEMKNIEKAVHHYILSLLSPLFSQWRTYSQQEKQTRIREQMLVDNREAFSKIMKETKEAVTEIINIQQEREKKQKEQDDEAFRRQRELKFEQAAAKAKEMKEEEKSIILNQQRIARQLRVQKQMKSMKKKFTKKYDKILEKMLWESRQNTANYLEHKDNKMFIDTRFKKLKSAFFAPPTPESHEKENMLTSFKNIVFAHLDVKLKSANIKIAKAIEKFDTDGKGYLTYEEFEKLISTFKLKFSAVQLNDIMRAADEDGDGYIDAKEMENGLIQSRTLAAPGSKWTMYVDPIQDVMCYHNIEAGEKILEYNMTDEKLKEILIEIIYAENRLSTMEKYHELRKTEWSKTLDNYYVRRIQYMYHRWKARSGLSTMLDKSVRDQDRFRRKATTFLYRMLLKFQKGFKARKAFKKQLWLTYEKIWDVDQKLLFWYNHQTQVSTWEMPPLLKRYGDVTTPSPWVPLDIATTLPNPTITTTVTAIDGLSSTNSAIVSAEPSRSQQKRSGDSSSSLYENDSIRMLTQESQVFNQKALLTDDLAQPSSLTIESASSSNTLEIHYWHVTAQSQLPRKPDGIPLCDYCYRNLAIHTCIECNYKYCLPCHRYTHCHPMAFLQVTIPTNLDPSEAQAYMEQAGRFKHTWIDTEPIKCDKCKTDKMYAGIYCQECQQSYCRPCSRRFHQTGAYQKHTLTLI